MEIEYRNRLFGDVLRDLVYTYANTTYEFAGMVGLNNVLLSNFMNHKKYPGIRTLKKVSNVLPEKQRRDFIIYYKNPATKEKSEQELGARYPYPIHAYSEDLSIDMKYSEINRQKLEGLQLQGLFKYLSKEEKVVFKEKILEYIIRRNLNISKFEE